MTINATLAARNAERKRDAEARRVSLLKVFAGYGGVLTIADVERAKIHGWRNALRLLMRDGKIARTGKARWALNDNGLSLSGATC